MKYYKHITVTPDVHDVVVAVVVNNKIRSQAAYIETLLLKDPLYKAELEKISDSHED